MDSWCPAADWETLKYRAEILARIRDFFQQRDVLEVETPIVCRASDPDPSLESFQTCFTGPGYPRSLPLFLRTSPEFHMKRLLCAGSGSIYQIAKSFRQGELGSRHEPEFTLLEWYRQGYDQGQLIEEINQLLACLEIHKLGLDQARCVSYRQVFKELVNLDPLDCDIQQLQTCLKRYDLNPAPDENRDFYLDLLLSHVISPQLGVTGPVYLTGFPRSQAALARLDPQDPRQSQRFELFIRGVEIANGFYELSDAGELETRLMNDIQSRQSQGKHSVPLDHALIQAHKTGLPDCAGVALGLDRLIMILSKKQTITEVMTFTEY